MFEKKVCPSCGEKVKDDWDFCPHCGEEIDREKEETDPFRSMFGNIDKEFERIDKDFEFGSFNLPRSTKPRMKNNGINIIIHGGTGFGPHIEVRTSGNFKKIEPEIKRRLGVGPDLEEVEEERIEEKTSKRKVPKTTEEPETKVQIVGNKQIISIKLPNIKSEDDVEVKKLEQSLEVKAFAGNKAYFKLIPIPNNANVSKKFDNGVLKLEIER